VRKALAALAGVVALAGAALIAVPFLEGRIAAQIKSQIEHGGISKVDEVSVGLFRRRIRLLNLREPDVSIGRWEASGMAWPLGELLAGRTPLAGFRWGDPVDADRIELENVKGTARATGGTWTIDSLMIDGFSLARYDGSANGPFRFTTLMARALGALTVQRIEQRNLRATLPGNGETASLASVVVEGYRRGHVASLSVAGLETGAAGQAARVNIAEVKASGIDFGRMIAAMSSDHWSPGGPSGRVHVEKANATGFGGELLRRYGISLDAVGFETVRESDRLSRSRTRIEGFVLSPPLRGLEGLSMRMALQAMGLKDIRAEFDCYGVEDRGKAELVIDRCALSGPGLGEIGFTARIVNADEIFWNAMDDGDMLALPDSAAALGSASLMLADRSLLERGLRAVSTMTGQPAAATRAAWAREIRRYQPPGVLISQAMTRLLDTVARFVEQGGTLTIEARPEPPVGFDRLEYLTSPGADLVSVLGLKATLSR
jgi:hypothetical protein